MNLFFEIFDFSPMPEFLLVLFCSFIESIDEVCEQFERGLDISILLWHFLVMPVECGLGNFIYLLNSLEVLAYLLHSINRICVYYIMN